MTFRLPVRRRHAALAGVLVGWGLCRVFHQPTPAVSPGVFAVVRDLALVARADGVWASAPLSLPRVPVAGIVDGDTLRVGWDGGTEFLRLYGVNTPERRAACWAEAAERARALAGSAVRLGFEERNRDKYGRLLAYVFTDDGRSVDAALVAEGFGRAWKRDGRFADLLTGLEDRARAAKTGCLWSRPEGEKKPPRRRPRRRSPA
jgi:endonuclease YncB( thermonuclease family)